MCEYYKYDFSILYEFSQYYMNLIRSNTTVRLRVTCGFVVLRGLIRYTRTGLPTREVEAFDTGDNVPRHVCLQGRHD